MTDDRPAEPCPTCDQANPFPRNPWDHSRSCPRWQPPLRGPGSTEAARKRALADIERAIARAKEQRR